MKLAFIPISILGGLLAGLIGQKAFDAIWAKVDQEEPPEPEHREISLAKLAIALVIEGAIFRLAKGLFDHAARPRFRAHDGRVAGRRVPREGLGPGMADDRTAAEPAETEDDDDPTERRGSD